MSQDNSPQPTIDTQNLAVIVTEWRRNSEEIQQLKQQVSEKGKRNKILEDIILKTMKQNNLGALDLKSSGGRILKKESQRKSGFNTKVLLKQLTEHLKDETKAAEAVKYLEEHRDATLKESLAYEKI